MRIVSIKTPKPKQFNYKPRYYDEQKDELEKRKAIRGIQSKLSHNESLKLKMIRRRRTDDLDDEKTPLSKLLTYFGYAFFIGGTVYFIMFTDIIEKMLSAFGVVN
ncbi:MAG: hypothetical protein QM503_13415 [Bacteroidota bacterium]